MGRLQTTISRLLVACLLPTLQHAVAAEDAAAPDTSAVTAMATLPVTESVTEIAISAEDDILALFGLYLEARSTGMLDEAEILAKQLVELSISSYGVQSKRTARALTDLGELQASNGDYRAALLNLAQAIEIIENLDNYLSMDLMNPIRTMADVQMRVGDVNLAAGNWRRALHISHVNLGPHNADQIETLLSLGRLYARAGKDKEANRIRKRIRYLQTREFDATGSALLRAQ